MKRRQGPTKKLAPVNSTEHACAHTYREEEGLQVEIDCRDCNGAHDLANRKCMSGIVTALVSSSAPEAVVLRRFTDKRYRGETVRFLTSCAAELSSMNRSLSLQSPPSDKRCRTCPASRANVVAAARSALLADPVAFMNDRNGVLSDLMQKMVASAGRCVDARECIGEMLVSCGFRSGADRLGP